MRSATGGAEELGTVAAPPDTSARARILEAAVLRFARSGFGASVRAIATDAGVSPALVIHHFGSKDKLHEACDEHVLAWIAKSKRENMGKATGGRLLEVLAQADEFAPLVGYVLRSMQAGGAVGKSFVEHMIDDAEKYTAEAVEQGLAKPSLDERARVRYLVYSSLGSLLLSVTMNPPDDPEDVNTAVRAFMDDLYLPMLELFTEGFLTTRRMLDDYLLYVGDPPPGAGEDEPAA
ncbi:TetR family transcriptional regulator [Isoptericola cucumis]|uniref:TetR/AcrR family transcriptional regulator n=1 Tax=Isoptericola cucumis TaxID=1776856 RepID=UPI003207F9B6